MSSLVDSALSWTTSYGSAIDKSDFSNKSRDCDYGSPSITAMPDFIDGGKSADLHTVVHEPRHVTIAVAIAQAQLLTPHGLQAPHPHSNSSQQDEFRSSLSAQLPGASRRPQGALQE